MCVNMDKLDVFEGFVYKWVSGWVSLFEVGIEPTIRATNNLHMGDVLMIKKKVVFNKVRIFRSFGQER